MPGTGRPMNVVAKIFCRASARIVAEHLFWAAVMTSTIYLTETSPRVSVYGFFISFIYRIFAVCIFTKIFSSGSSRARAAAARLTSPPHPARKSQPISAGKEGHERPCGPGPYLFLAILFGSVTFVLLNQTSDGRDMAVSSRDMLRELGWGTIFGLMWLAQDLAGRRVTVMPGASVPTNLGYSSSDLGAFFLALAVGIPLTLETSSLWPYFALLVLLKTGFDIADEVKFPSSPAA